MFYTFGGKIRLARHYPAPAFNTIIEPFGGGAGYSMYHLDAVDRVILYEKDPRVVELWKFLRTARPDTLLRHSIPDPGTRTMDYLIITASTSAAAGVSRAIGVTERMATQARQMIERIAREITTKDLRKVEVIAGDYSQAPNVEATWFIDPPYQKVVAGYAPGCGAGDMNFETLSRWCRNRRGQVIVCEKEGANWLPFTLLREHTDGLGKNYNEVVFLKGVQR